MTAIINNSPPLTIRGYDHPWRFYILATLVPWSFWLIAAYISHHWLTHFAAYAIPLLGILGLIAPTVIAFKMMYCERLQNDIWQRFSLRGVGTKYLVLTFGTMLFSILLAQAISLLFGHSTDQFSFADHASFSAGILPGWFMILLAPLIEELAWHSYGTDTLRKRMNLFNTSLIFGVFWVVWHVPLGLVKGYYHANVAESSWIYSVNFAVSLLPFVILMNWLYYKTGRNITIAIVFHISAGLFNEIFNTHPDSKVIQTGLLMILSLILLYRDRHFFFKRNDVD